MITIPMTSITGTLPRYTTPGAAGVDLPADHDGTLLPGRRKLVTTGLKIAIPAGYEAQIRPRSGMANRHGVTVLNSPGTIDSDYRGEIGVILVNLGANPFNWKAGDRIAQLVIAPVVQAVFEVVDELPETERGDGGFGSSGR